MCGLVAIFSPTGQVDAEGLTRVTSALAHRGPDGQGQWISPSRHIGLGHTRLAIIDLAGGAQPIANEDNTVHIIVNGELYDFERIRDDLVSRGHRFRTGSDSEIALHLYEDLGTACLERLRGEFAFVLWDERRRTLFAARDRLAMKPLYYAWHQGHLIVASEVKALLSAGVPARWDPEHFYDSASFQSTTEQGGGTLFAGVYQLPPGHFLLAREEHDHRVTRYWDFDFARRADIPARTLEENAERVRESLEDAVRIRLRADVPVACYLSGGIDSAWILALACKHSRNPVRALTMSFTEPGYDESALAEPLARALGAEFERVSIVPDEMADVFEETVWHAESYLWNTNSMAKFLLSRGVRKAGFKVILSGQGADEVFAGYHSFLLDLQTAGQSPAWPASLPPHAVKSLSHVQNALGFVPSYFAEFTELASGTHGLLNGAFGARFAGRLGHRLFLDSLPLNDQLDGRDTLSQTQYLWNKSTLVDYLLSVVGDRPEMANSVESRLPFLDHHLIATAASIPADQRIAGSTMKHVLREAARGVLPDDVRTRKKKPFMAPPASMTPTSRLYQLTRDTISKSLPDFFDRSKVARFIHELRPVEQGRFVDSEASQEERSMLAADYALMFLASTSMLQQRFRLTAP